ncbi:TlpA family protein disulfide reductase [Mariprofundus sp. EBB-1]|nr:TlpA family protein disulfide reductase [Mariprofundus sp. EBB-1]
MRMLMMMCALFLHSALIYADPMEIFGVVQPKVRMMAPDFSLKGVDGNMRTLSSLRGKSVILHFWATWCAPCRQEMPVLHALSKELEDKNFVLLCVNVDRGNQDGVKAFMEEIKPGFNSLLDPEGDVRNAYSIRALPTSYLIGRDGKISGLIMGERDWSKAAPALFNMMQGDVKDIVE